MSSRIAVLGRLEAVERRSRAAKGVLMKGGNVSAAIRKAGLSMGGEHMLLKTAPRTLQLRTKAHGLQGIPRDVTGPAHRRSSQIASREPLAGGFVPSFYLLNADNAAGYANKNPEPAHFSDVDPARKLVFVVHGILGTGRNWVPFTRKLVSKFPDWQFILVDQRGHGESDFPLPAQDHSNSAAGGSALGIACEHTVDACAQDLENLCLALGRSPEVVIGHSFGGKVALHFHMMAQKPPARTWILDSHLGTFDIGNLLKDDPAVTRCQEVNMHMKPGSSSDIMTVLASIPTPIHDRAQVASLLLIAHVIMPRRIKAGMLHVFRGPDLSAEHHATGFDENRFATIRQEVTAQLKLHGFSKTTIMWLLSNLKPLPSPSRDAVEGGVTPRKRARLMEWRFNIDISRALITDASRVDSLPLLNKDFRQDNLGKVGIVRGLSGIQWEDTQLMRFQGCVQANGRVEEYLLEAGHWIHVMKPDELIAIMSSSLSSS